MDDTLAGTLRAFLDDFGSGTGPSKGNVICIAFSHSGASVLSWRADRDYSIIEVTSVSTAAAGASAVNFAGDTFANLVPSSGVISRCICVITGTQRCRPDTRIVAGQLLYSSSNQAYGIQAFLQPI